MSEELEVLKIVTQRLDEAKMNYMLSGSMAANYYTVPRMTRDIDVVVELEAAHIDKFVSLFQDDFYIDKQGVRKEVSRGGMFNLIHHQYVIKIDFIIRKATAFQDSSFTRRKKVFIEDVPMWFITAEDLIISKLDWARESHSQMQLKDVANLLNTVKNLDFIYIERWVKALKLEEIYQDAKNE